MNALLLSLGTLTVLPVPAPRVVDRRVAGWAMTLAPVAGLLLALVAGLPVALLRGSADSLLLATLAVATLALLTRAIHLDGLADTADGLGSAQPADRALAIMKQSDIGPFGVVTIVLTLFVQVAALAPLLDSGQGLLAAGVSLVVSRGVLPLLCTPAFPSARPDGLGGTVAGAVEWWQAAVVAAAVGATAVAAGAPYPLLGLLAGLGLALWCRRRLGGLTGDVYGACVEVTLAAALLTAAIWMG